MCHRHPFVLQVVGGYDHNYVLHAMGPQARFIVRKNGAAADKWVPQRWVHMFRAAHRCLSWRAPAAQTLCCCDCCCERPDAAAVS